MAMFFKGLLEDLKARLVLKHPRFFEWRGKKEFGKIIFLKKKRVFLVSFCVFETLPRFDVTPHGCNRSLSFCNLVQLRAFHRIVVFFFPLFLN